MHTGEKIYTDLINDVKLDDSQKFIASLKIHYENDPLKVSEVALQNLMHSILEWHAVNCLKEMTAWGIDFKDNALNYVETLIQIYQFTNVLDSQKNKILIFLDFLVDHFKIDLNEHTARIGEAKYKVPYIIIIADHPDLVEFYLRHKIDLDKQFKALLPNLVDENSNTVNIIQAIEYLSKSMGSKEGGYAKSLTIIKHYQTAKKEREELTQEIKEVDMRGEGMQSEDKPKLDANKFKV